MATKAQKEMERQEEQKDSSALPSMETTMEMSAQEKRAMRGMVVWNVAPSEQQEEHQTPLEHEHSKESKGWELLAKQHATGKRRTSTKKVAAVEFK
jgi:hypothetical protein